VLVEEWLRGSEFEDVQKVLRLGCHTAQVVLQNVLAEDSQTTIATVLECHAIPDGFSHSFLALLWGEVSPDRVHLATDIAVFACEITLQFLHVLAILSGPMTDLVRHDSGLQKAGCLPQVSKSEVFVYE
jgi:hypothetical protein